MGIPTGPVTIKKILGQLIWKISQFYVYFWDMQHQKIIENKIKSIEKFNL